MKGFLRNHNYISESFYSTFMHKELRNFLLASGITKIHHDFLQPGLQLIKYHESRKSCHIFYKFFI